MPLIYLSPVPWYSFAQRPQKFVRWFHAVTGDKVLWVEPYPSRFPSLSDLKKRSVSDRTEEDRDEPWLTVLKPGALPIEPLPGSGMINGTLIWKAALAKIKAFAAQPETLLVIGKPTVFALELMKALPDIESVYDSMDDFPSFYKGWSKHAMGRREQAITRQVTHLIVSSTVLKHKWASVRSDIHVIPNALDAELLPQPKLTAARGQARILGYVGTIGAWFDWQWVISLAKARPHDTIRLIGPMFNAPQLALPENIELLPACSHQQALNSMLEFDVALIPFLKTPLTASVDPIKYYEFKALGLPVISTDFGEMTFRAGEKGVFLTSENSTLSEHVDQALMYKAVRDEIEQFRIENSWHKRFSNIPFIKPKNLAP